MQTGLTFAAVLLFCIGVAHSWLGEHYILTPLFRRNSLPRLFGGTEFTRRTLRFAWNLTTIAWWGFAAVLLLIARPPVAAGDIGKILGAVFLIHFVVALAGSRGKHLSWIVFLIVGVLSVFLTH